MRYTLALASNSPVKRTPQPERRVSKLPCIVRKIVSGAPMGYVTYPSSTLVSPIVSRLDRLEALWKLSLEFPTPPPPTRNYQGPNPHIQPTTPPAPGMTSHRYAPKCLSWSGCDIVSSGRSAG